MSRISERNKRRLLTAAKLAVVLAVVWGVHRTVVEALEDLADYPWRLEPAWLVASGVLYLVGLLPAAWFWHRVLHYLGQQPGRAETLRAYFVGHIGKYVPGKALVLVLRVGMLTGSRVETKRAAVSVFYETLSLMGVGALVAAAIVVWRFPDRLWLAGAALVVGIGLLALCCPPVLTALMHLGRMTRLDPEIVVAIRGIHLRRLMVGWLGMVPGWMAMGLSMWATLRAIGAANLTFPGDWPLCTLSVSLAIVAGFLAMLPGGAVVREAVLMELLVPRFGEATALASALVLRLVYLVSEVAISVILYGYARWAGVAPSTERPPQGGKQSS